MDLGTKPSCKRSGRRRPSFDIPPAILEELRELGFTWPRIAKILNVSRSTIHRRLTDHGLEGKFSGITDAELDHVIEDYRKFKKRRRLRQRQREKAVILLVQTTKVIVLHVRHAFLNIFED